jgi:hypothetical protein
MPSNLPNRLRQARIDSSTKTYYIDSPTKTYYIRQQICSTPPLVLSGGKPPGRLDDGCGSFHAGIAPNAIEAEFGGLLQNSRI